MKSLLKYLNRSFFCLQESILDDEIDIINRGDNALLEDFAEKLQKWNPRAIIDVKDNNIHVTHP